jgi:hypothetical protein
MAHQSSLMPSCLLACHVAYSRDQKCRDKEREKEGEREERLRERERENN